MSEHSSREVELRWLGLQNYSTGLFHQRRAFARIRAGGAAEVLALQHTGVVTLGRGVEAKDEIHGGRLPSNVEVRSTSRGGDATLHMPGQLVVYPVLPIRELEIGPRLYVDGLLSALERALGALGIATVRREGRPGLFTAIGKIAFVGVRIDRGITQHGVSLNMSNSLESFGWIRSCGVDGESFDRVIDHAPKSTIQEVAGSVFSELCREFNLTSLEIPH